MKRPLAMARDGCRVRVASARAAVLLLCSVLWACAANGSGAGAVRMTGAEVLAFTKAGGFDYRALRATLPPGPDSGWGPVAIELVRADSAVPADVQAARAFWIDAYNTGAVVRVVHHWPMESVMDVDDYFTARRLNVGGELLSLDDIEKRKLFGSGGDPRVHFAIVCASASCPPLYDRPFAEAADLDALLDSLTGAVVNDTQYVMFDFARGEARLSKLFEWYASDFAGPDGSVLPFIARYHRAGARVAQTAWEVSYRDYDWSLNQRPR